jgi:hypothetical protein
MIANILYIYKAINFNLDTKKSNKFKNWNQAQFKFGKKLKLKAQQKKLIRLILIFKIKKIISLNSSIKIYVKSQKRLLIQRKKKWDLLI